MRTSSVVIFGLASLVSAGCGVDGADEETAKSSSACCSLAIDAYGNLYVADTGNHAIRKVAPNGDVSTIASGASLSPSFDPKHLAVAPNGTIYATSAHALYRITQGSIACVAGAPATAGFSDGALGQSAFREPKGVAVDRLGDVYVADSGNHAIRKLVVATGLVHTIASQPPFDPTRGFFDTYGPHESVIDKPTSPSFWGDRLVFGDEGRLTIRTLNPAAPN
jgi:sugar lactone lactonase YvrE